MSSNVSTNLNENADLVSVLIPAYNHERYVQDAIRSVIAQTCPNIELIVVNDGSKDSTWEKINEMEAECRARFSRVVFLTQENAGTCITLNRLVEQAQGAYVLVLDSDDKLFPETIEKELAFLKNHPEYIGVYGNSVVIDENSNRRQADETRKTATENSLVRFDCYMEVFRYYRTDIDFSKDFTTYWNLIVGNFVLNGVLLSRQVLEKVGPYTTEAPLEDYWLHLQVVKYGKYKYLDEPLLYYRLHDSNTINNGEKMWKMLRQTLRYERKELVKRHFLLGNFLWCCCMLYRKMMNIRLKKRYHAKLEALRQRKASEKSAD